MADKQAPLGICDVCGGPIPREEWYTSKRGTPRLHCSLDCKNAGNSRAGAEERGRKARQRVERGEWQNPARLNPPDPANVSAGISRSKKSAVEAGTWQNPALTDEARAKLSRPRKHNGALASAIEKLGAGAKVSELTPEEADAHRAYQRELRAARSEEINRSYRERYHKRQATMTEEEKEAQRQRWREANRKRGRQ